ncbi:Chitinase [Hexamita inflata]|uniref:Chitinase n=1 Tax=Hexamita inflata TaxID=28002 RepID=A0AA86QHC9_9EUKA|nr:Chitinase [Hexamita inflata]
MLQQNLNASIPQLYDFCWFSGTLYREANNSCSAGMSFINHMVRINILAPKPDMLFPFHVQETQNGANNNLGWVSADTLTPISLTKTDDFKVKSQIDHFETNLKDIIYNETHIQESGPWAGCQHIRDQFMLEIREILTKCKILENQAIKMQTLLNEQNRQLKASEEVNSQLRQQLPQERTFFVNQEAILNGTLYRQSDSAETAGSTFNDHLVVVKRILTNNVLFPVLVRETKNGMTNDLGWVSFSSLKHIQEQNEDVKENIPKIELKQVTMTQLQELGWKNISPELLQDLNETLDKYKIIGIQSIRHFLSQCAHESALGYYTKEIADGNAYEGRADIGNTQPGDGSKYKGAGFLQVTGRYNYQQFADSINDQQVMNGCDYVATKYPWKASGNWWFKRNMTAFCNDGATVEQVTQKVNGGQRGIEQRIKYYNICCGIFK